MDNPILASVLAIAFFISSGINICLFLLLRKSRRQTKNAASSARMHARDEASSRDRLLRDLYVALLNLQGKMEGIRGSVPGGTAAAWRHEVEAITVFLLMRRGSLPELTYIPGRSNLSDNQILKLSTYEGGIKWIYEAVRDGRCLFSVDVSPTMSHEEYVLRDFPEILRRIGELRESETPSPA